MKALFNSALSGVIAVFGAILLFSFVSRFTRPQFHLGDCVTSTLEREEWEPARPTYRIVGVGRHSYQVSANGQAYSWGLPFDSGQDQHRKKVECPQ